ncbi:MAG: guanylate kinase, partial [Rhodoluna sp.]
VVHGQNKYGTPKQPVIAALQSGKPVILEIDIQGARQVKASMPEAKLVFIAPPSWDELVNRLQGRGTESEEEQARRLETAKAELAAQSEFDHVVINDEVARCASEVVDLMQA